MELRSTDALSFHRNGNVRHTRQTVTRLKSPLCNSGSERFKMADALRDDDLLVGPRHRMRGGHGGNERVRRPARNGPRRFGMQRLQRLQDKDSAEVLLELVNKENGLETTLNDATMGNDMIKLMLRSLASACECESSPSQLISLLDRLCNSRFLNEIVLRFLTVMVTDFATKRARDLQQSIRDIVTILIVLSTKMPTSAAVLGLNSILKFTVERLQETSTIIDDEIVQGVKEIDELGLQNTRKHRRVTRENNDDDNRHPPDDFRGIPVFPRLEDIHINEGVFLRSNKVKGGYMDLEHYLDVQFRLLREDFIYPLRQGITEYLAAAEDDKAKKKRITELRIYNDVNILCPVCTHNGLNYRLRFSLERLGRVKWQKTRRLIFGSLICLSSDNFRTLYFATVANRDAKALEQGLVDVTFEQDQEQISAISPDVKFIMAETTAYFEAYRHVLSGLKNMRENDLPFQKYIVNCENRVDLPSYLRNGNGSTFDLRPLVDDTVVIRGDSRLETIGETTENETVYKFNKESEPAAKVNIQDVTSWPSSDLLHLDESQWQAMYTALTQEFSITQGPPGTGKTYIGLKIVKALLYNHKLWNRTMGNEDDHRPMLIVCYTNHALDQFLEGIIGFFKGDVIRVGGRSASEALKDYNLKSYRMKFRSEKEIPQAIHRAKMSARNEMKNNEEEINNISQRIQSAKMEILHEDVLKPFMDESYNDLVSQFEVMRRSFHEVHGRHKRRSAIVEWLDLGNFLTLDQNQAVANPNAPNIQNQAPAPGAQLVDVVDEIAAIEAQRQGDNDDDDSDDAASDSDDEDILTDDIVPIHKLKLTANDIALNVSEIDHKFESNPFGWQITKKQRKTMKRHIRRELGADDCMTEDQAALVMYVWDLLPDDRWRLYRYWIRCYCERLREEIRGKERDFQEAAERYTEVLFQEDREILRLATVIGMTTTCAARYQAVLQEISPRIIVVEEAAEVLEAHVITTLSRACQHLILIGDHQQLKPNPTVYKLARDYNLEVSLFERMINNDLKLETLRWQHRMRPEIADIMRNIYPDLRDNQKVEQYEHIKGISSDVYFINHSYYETNDEDSMSHCNEFEAEYIVALCRYLLLQGYDPEQITILTMYSGQLFAIKTSMPKVLFEGVKLTSVDNYQGEENDIILLSLVRSNEAGSAGFVKVDNRICVALSRARKGLYVVGNFDLLEDQSELWRTIVCELRRKNRIGGELRLHCQNHPNDAGIAVHDTKDFQKAPEGGCMKPCGIRLPCGHACAKVCHILDQEHTNYKCTKPCSKILCQQGHRCQKRCHEKCGKCMLPTKKIIPRCGHTQNVPCGIEPQMFLCESACTTYLACGHRCRELCGKPHTGFCQTIVKKKWICGHQSEVKCCDKKTALCGQKCTSVLKCGDLCTGTCGECLRGKVHVPCSSICHRILVCGHECMDRCANNACPPCQRACQNRCTHSKCQKQCGETCVPCNEPCVWRCNHYKCSKNCSEICDRPRCNAPCPKRLECGHSCCGVCGEPCPRKCRVCNIRELTEIFFGTEDEPDARFVELEDCGHVFECTGLDHYMDNDNEGNIQMKLCPRCKTPIRRNLRYGNIVKRVLLNIEKVKSKLLGDPKDIDLLFLKVQKRIKNSLSAADSRWMMKTFSYQNKQIKSERLLMTMNNTVFFLNQIRKLREHSSQLERPSFTEQLCSVVDDLGQLESCVKRERKYMADQEIEEIEDELLRIAYTIKFFRHQEVIMDKGVELNAELEQSVRYVSKVFKSGLKLDDRNQSIVKECIARLKEVAPYSPLGISEDERMDILKAMGLEKGHWFACKNGHIYAIGECGGATTEGVCPECKETIGGGSHTLRSDNRLAPEMDGAEAAAWPSALIR
ncbi:hypothetical protein ScPMuIL_017561 [Solemya velum]